MARFCEYPPIASYWLAGDLSILWFDRYRGLFGLHLRLSARPVANRSFIARLQAHKYIRNSIESVFVPAQGAWLLQGLDQHIFIESRDRYCERNWLWLPSAYYRSSCYYGEYTSVRHWYNDYNSSYYTPTVPWSWGHTVFPSLTHSGPLPTPAPGPSSRRAQAPLTTDQVCLAAPGFLAACVLHSECTYSIFSAGLFSV